MDQNDIADRFEAWKDTMTMTTTPLDRYPNLHAIVAGTVSGNITEWPAIRSELVALVDSFSDVITERDEWEAANSRALNSMHTLMQQRDENAAYAAALLGELRRDVMALAHASEQHPEYTKDYERCNAAIEKYRALLERESEIGILDKQAKEDHREVIEDVQMGHAVVPGFPNIREWCRGSPTSIVITFVDDITSEQMAAIPKALMDALYRRHSQVPKQQPPKVEPIFKLPQPKRSFKVGDQAGCYVGNHHGELTAGLVVAILDLPGWQWPHYVIEIETGIDPIYEVRDGFTAHPCHAQWPKSDGPEA